MPFPTPNAMLCFVASRKEERKKGQRPSKNKKIKKNQQNISDSAHASPPRQGPRLRADDLALAVSPEVDAHADEVVDARVGALVQQQGAQAGQGVDGQAGLDAAVHGGGGEGEERHGPLPGEGEEAEQQVDALQDGDGAHGRVEVGGEEVPEDLGPEEGFEGGGDLVFWGRKGLLVFCKRR